MGKEFKPLGLTRHDYYGNTTHYLPVSYSNNEINVGLPEITITPRNNLDLAGVVRLGMSNAARKGVLALSLTTPLGDIEDIHTIYKDIELGDYDLAGIGAALMFLPGFMAKPIKKAARSGKRFMRHVKGSRSNHYINTYNLPIEEIAEKKTTSDLGHGRYLETPLYDKTDLEDIRDDYVKLQEQNSKLEDEISDYLTLYDPDSALELKTIFKEDPRYFNFVRTNNLNPFDQNTVDTFLKKQFTHVRGVSFPANTDDDLVQRALTTNNKINKGGDRLRTDDTGVYVSNSGEIADRFSRPQHGKDSRSDIAIVTYPHNINRSLSIRELLAQARRKIFPDIDFIESPPGYKLLSLHGYVAKEAPYTTRKGNVLPGYERAYFDKDLNKKLLDIEDQTTRYGLLDAKGRWGLKGVLSIPELEAKLFEGNNVGTSFGDFVHLMKTLKDPQNKLLIEYYNWYPTFQKNSSKIRDTMHRRVFKSYDLKDQFTRSTAYKIYKNITDPATWVLTGLGGIASFGGKKFYDDYTNNKKTTELFINGLFDKIIPEEKKKEIKLMIDKGDVFRSALAIQRYLQNPKF